MFGMGMGEIVVVLVIVLLLFGPSRLPEIARALGKAIKTFNKATRSASEDTEETGLPSKKDS